VIRSSTYTCLHWLTAQPTPYNDYLFRSLAPELCVDLTVHYRVPSLASHPWKTAFGQGYRCRFYKAFFGIDWHILAIALKNRRAFFLIAGWDHPTSLALLIVLRTMKRPYALWTDTPNLETQRRKVCAALRQTFLTWVFTGARRILGTGDPGVTALRKMGVSDRQLVSFPYFVDIDAYANRKIVSVDRNDERPLRIISVGRLSNSLKGHDIAMRALAQVVETINGRRLEYCLAGSGPDEGALRQLAQNLRLAEIVRFMGWVEPGELAELYQQADILIHASPVHDPFGNAVLEAMAAGLVVFASDVSGSALDRIEHGVNGFLHKAGDANDLAGQLEYIARHTDHMAEISKRARLTAEQWPVGRGIAIIRELISSDESKIPPVAGSHIVP
jgi:glycosyltransferase involved in cell wall biosynthesis